MTSIHMKSLSDIQAIDLKFLGLSGAIAAYLLPHQEGAALIECGPGATIPHLKAGLAASGYPPEAVTDVFLTHIHLDHAGAAGWLARHGARIHVHPIGAPHLHSPEKLLASARRIYGDHMDSLWGKFLPVPEEKIYVMHDEECAEIGGRSIRAVDTPGHAYHHHSYLLENICFSGDIGGVRLAGARHVRLPMPPPEFHLESWRQSLGKLKAERFDFIAPTHFGFFSDPEWHLSALEEALDEVEAWMEAIMPRQLPLDELNDEFLEWTRQRSLAAGLPLEVLDVYEAANPSWMSTQGIQRYWEKNRSGKTSQTSPNLPRD